MTCKDSGGQKKKYIYYHCSNCKLYYREDLIEDCLIDYLLELVEYDYNVKKYFYPIFDEKKNYETNQIQEEINKLKAQKDRLKKAYMNGILEMEDFSADYNLIESKLSDLESKQIDALEYDKEFFNPQHIMAERDIKKLTLTKHEMYKSVLLKIWSMKTKDEKQEFISKFIDTATLDKKEDATFEIKKIDFRSSFVEQLDKLYDIGLVDIPYFLDIEGKQEDVRISVNINKKTNR